MCYEEQNRLPKMNLPFGATQADFILCKGIIAEYKQQDTNGLALDLLNTVYAMGGDYSEKTLRAFAEAYLID